MCEWSLGDSGMAMAVKNPVLTDAQGQKADRINDGQNHQRVLVARRRIEHNGRPVSDYLLHELSDF
jgi:hypothetical protein